jgi:excisionase family DNA binding protein
VNSDFETFISSQIHEIKTAQEASLALNKIILRRAGLDPDFVTIKEAAEYLGVSHQKVREAFADEIVQVPGMRLYRIRREVLEKAYAPVNAMKAAKKRENG